MRPPRSPAAHGALPPEGALAALGAARRRPDVPGRRQSGAALLMAMITVALVATLAAGSLWRQWRGVEVERAERARVQSDWILTGTPAGVGLGQKPAPWFLKPGDVVRLGGTGLGEQVQKYVGG